MGRRKKLPHEKKSADRSSYNKWYYDENKNVISEKRKRKYREDPKYKKRILESNCKYKKDKREERKKLIEEGKLLIKKRKEYVRKPISIEINGKVKQAYPLSDMLKQIDRSRNSVNFWTYIGLFPKSPILKSGRFRFYTDEMIFIVRMALQRRVKISPTDRSFHDEIYEGWKELGVYGEIKYL